MLAVSVQFKNLIKHLNLTLISIAGINLSNRDNIPDKISFVEYAISLSALLKGSLEDKLAWTFQLYDVAGDGNL